MECNRCCPPLSPARLASRALPVSPAFSCHGSGQGKSARASRLKLQGEEGHNTTTATDTMEHGRKECKTAGHVVVRETAFGHGHAAWTYLNLRMSENRWTWILAWVRDRCVWTWVGKWTVVFILDHSVSRTWDDMDVWK